MNRRRFITTTMTGAVATGAAATIAAAFIEPRRVEFTMHCHALDGAGPLAFAHISDLHIAEVGGVHERIAGTLLRDPLDFMVLTGDSVNDTGALAALDAFLALLPDVPKYAVIGNWEHWGRVDRNRFSRVMERHGGRLLVNESVLHGDLLVTGLDDLLAGAPDVDVALRDAPDAAGRVLLAHCPLQRDLLSDCEPPFDLVLSGHTHGGQVAPFGWAPVLPKASGRYVAGWYRDAGAPPLYVSRGVGTTLLPIRLGARPEVAFFT